MSTKEEKTGAGFLCAKINLKTRLTGILRKQLRSHNNLAGKRLRTGTYKTPIGVSEHSTSDG